MTDEDRAAIKEYLRTDPPKQPKLTPRQLEMLWLPIPQSLQVVDSYLRFAP